MLSICPNTTARVLACALALAMLEMAHGQSAPPPVSKIGVKAALTADSGVLRLQDQERQRSFRKGDVRDRESRLQGTGACLGQRLRERGSHFRPQPGG